MVYMAFVIIRIAVEIPSSCVFLQIILLSEFPDQFDVSLLRFGRNDATFVELFPSLELIFSLWANGLHQQLLKEFIQV